MTTSTQLRGARLAPTGVLEPAILLGAVVASAGLVAVFGVWSLMLLVYATLVVLAIFAPQRAAAVLLFTAIALEPGAADFTRPLSRAIWEMPEGLTDVVPFTTSPFELVTFSAAVSAMFRWKSRSELPRLAWVALAAVLMGVLFGLSRGAPPNLVYHELRGLAVGCAMFVLASRTLPRDTRRLVLLVMAAQVVLAIVVICRYVFVVRPEHYKLPLEFMFAHESSIIFGIGLVVGLVVLFRHAGDLRAKALTCLYCVLIVAAMAVTGRRAATLVGLTAIVTTAVMLFPVRPKTVMLALSVFALLFGAYLSVYWDRDYGATSQPARAVRSQFDPSTRDESSDTYRQTEKFNVIQTIRTNEVLGVGFGKEFYEFEPLPDLTAWWPLQMYSPHQNILWLWLKMGILGMTAFIGLILVALSRAVATIRTTRKSQEWSFAVVAFSGILMFLIYATVDIAFLGARSIAPLAIMSAVALAAGRVVTDKAQE